MDTAAKIKNDKKTEKLDALRKKRADIESKSKGIDAQIAKIEKEIHTENIRRLEKSCSAKNISFADLIAFVDMLSDDIKLSDVTEMISPNDTKNTVTTADSKPSADTAERSIT